MDGICISTSRHASARPSQPTGPATIFNGSRNRIQKANNVGWMDDREGERGERDVEYGEGGGGWESVKPLVYWEGGRRTTDIRRLKIERKTRREQLKRRKYCELISVARGWILVSCRGDVEYYLNAVRGDVQDVGDGIDFPFPPPFSFCDEAFNVARYITFFHWVHEFRRES